MDLPDYTEEIDIEQLLHAHLYLKTRNKEEDEHTGFYV